MGPWLSFLNAHVTAILHIFNSKKYHAAYGVKWIENSEDTLLECSADNIHPNIW